MKGRLLLSLGVLLGIFATGTSWGGTVQTSLTASADTTLWSKSSDYNSGLTDFVYVGAAASGAINRVGLFKFDLPDDFKYSTMASAELRLQYDSNVANSGEDEIRARAVLHDWNEGPGGNPASSGATWDDYDVPNPWPGSFISQMDTDPTRVATLLGLTHTVEYPTDSKFLIFDVTQMAAAWADGTLANYGIAITDTETPVIDPANFWVFSRDTTVPNALKPTLFLDYKPPLAGDVHGDGFVGGSDLAQILANWGLTQATRRQGDLNQDGVVGRADYNAVMNHWAEHAPEPATLGLWLTGSLVLLMRRRFSPGRQE